MTIVLVVAGLLLPIGIILLVAKRFLASYGECSITINGEKSFKVSGGDSLLSYLNREKIYIPSACGGKANCGFCKVKTLSGAGKILPTEETYVTRREAEEGIRLACQVKVQRDVDIHIPEYLLEAEEFESEVTEVEDLTHDIKLVRLKILNSKTIDFKPGQYIQFKIPGTEEYRAYSIASPPSLRDQLELNIRLVPGGLCSTYVHRALEVGDKVVFTGPFGDFHLREDSDREIIAIGGGCGMAPIRSIAYYLAERGMPRKFSYFFGARTKKDLFFTEEFEELEEKFPNFRYITALSEPRPEDRWEGEVGFITQTAEKYIELDGEKEAYLCGPPPMLNAAMQVLNRNGVDSDNIYFDKF